MRTYITSDLHLDHRNILEFEPRRGERWGTTEASLRVMQCDLIAECRSVLQRGDRLMILGDICLGNRTKLHAMLHEMLPGRPISDRALQVVPGNHDTRQLHQLEAAGELPAGVHLLPPIYCMGHTGTRLVLCHYPIESWPGMRHREDHVAAGDEAEAQKWGTVHLHGHSHGRGRVVLDRLDVSWDAHGRILELGEAVALARAV
jgi:calcineurin-like phosphoesterase family protein